MIDKKDINAVKIEQIVEEIDDWELLDLDTLIKNNLNEIICTDDLVKKEKKERKILKPNGISGTIKYSNSIDNEKNEIIQKKVYSKSDMISLFKNPTLETKIPKELIKFQKLLNFSFNGPVVIKYWRSKDIDNDIVNESSFNKKDNIDNKEWIRKKVIDNPDDTISFPIRIKNENKSLSSDRNVLLRKVNLILNQLTEEKFESLILKIDALELCRIELDSNIMIESITNLIIKKIQGNSQVSSLFCKLISRLILLWNINKDSNTLSYGNLFREYLLNKCKQVFVDKEILDIEPLGELTKNEYKFSKNTSFFNFITFLGDLYLIGILKSSILLSCSLDIYESILLSSNSDSEDHIICLCGLLNKIGFSIDQYYMVKNKSSFDNHFVNIKTLLTSSSIILSSRSKFILEELINARSIWLENIISPKNQDNSNQLIDKNNSNDNIENKSNKIFLPCHFIDDKISNNIQKEEIIVEKSIKNVSINPLRDINKIDNNNNNNYNNNTNDNNNVSNKEWENVSSKSTKDTIKKDTNNNVTNSIYVGNIKKDLFETRIREFFSDYGKIKNISLPKQTKEKYKYLHKGFAIITYHNYIDANRAINNLQGGNRYNFKVYWSKF
jgi:hypothetical protein